MILQLKKSLLLYASPVISSPEYKSSKSGFESIFKPWGYKWYFTVYHKNMIKLYFILKYIPLTDITPLAYFCMLMVK